MKSITLTCLAALVFLTFPACRSAEKRDPAITTTTTTEEHVVRTPVQHSMTTETQTIRSY